MIGPSLNQYKEMVVLVGSDENDLLNQIRSIPHVVSIVSMYAAGTRHYCWLVSDRKLKLVKQEPEKRKSLEDLKKKLNKEK